MSSLQEKWERRATVRSRPRIIYNKDAGGYYYPVSKTPLVLHPMVVARGEKAKEFILIQSLYKYSNDIATIETKIVNNSILKVLNGQLPISFSNEQKINLYTVMIDESYHAYVAYDCMLQIENYTGVSSLELPKTIEIEKAINQVKRKLDVKYHSVFDLICVCIAENTLTKEIVSMTDKKETHPFFQKIIKDHLADESRHSGIFFKLLGHIWSNLDNDFKNAIGHVLADFIELYLDLDVQKKYDRSILTELNFTDKDSSQILEDIYGGFKLTHSHPMIKNIIVMLEKTNVLDDYTLYGFKYKGWV